MDRVMVLVRVAKVVFSVLGVVTTWICQLSRETTTPPVWGSHPDRRRCRLREKFTTDRLGTYMKRVAEPL